MVDTKTIASNTVYLYIRTIVIIIISLYSSRIVLDALGITDWGIYSVVGGFVGMFSFINTSMNVATQRFLTFELGKGENGNISKVFSHAINIHVIIAVITIIAVEVIGCYFIEYKLNVPVNRKHIASICFQLSIIALTFEIIKVPFIATIIAYEKMGSFAYLDVAYNSLKLISALALYYFSSSRLVAYSSFICIISLLLFFCYVIYCKKKFINCRYRLEWDKMLFKEVTSFAGWVSFSAISVVLRDQCINVIYNLFIGVWINAAYAVAQQVHATIYKLINNLAIAFSPQITKSIAADHIASSIQLVKSGSKFSVILYLYFFIPVLFKMDFVLDIWLTEVPLFTSMLIKLLLINSLCILYAASSITTVRAKGEIAKYEIIVNTINFTFFFLTYVGMKLKNVYYVPMVLLITSSFLQMLVIIYLSCKILNYSYWSFINEVVVKSLWCLIPSFIITYLVNILTINTWVSFFVVILTSITCVSITGYSFYLNTEEKLKTLNIISNAKERFFKKTNSRTHS